MIKYLSRIVYVIMILRIINNSDELCNFFFFKYFLVLFCAYECHTNGKKQNYTLVFILFSIDTLDGHRTIQFGSDDIE